MRTFCGFFACCLALANGGSFDRIIGGSDAPNHKYPYQVSLRERQTGYLDFHFCSGSIVNEKWILSASHCFQGRDLVNIWAVMGTNYLNEIGESYKVCFVIKHEKFSTFYHDDIALVRVDGKIKFNEYVKSIALPTQQLFPYYIKADFAGWGSTEIGGPAPNALQEITLTLIPYEKCLENRSRITRKHICTYNSYGQGTCYGDSGGPLVVDGIQVGIASYIKPCAIGYPDVYTNVLSYMDWITQTQRKYYHLSLLKELL